MATVWVLFCVFLLPGVWCLQWSAGTEDGATLYVCEGRELTLPWTITPDTGEQIIDITWLFQGHSDQMIAIYGHSNFLPTPPYSQRVQLLSNAGISLIRVTAGDAGNYTVEVQMDDGTGGHSIHSRYAVLHVASEPSARLDASLEVVQQSVAVYNNHTDQYHVQLTCTGHGLPPHDVIWTTPRQQTVQSSSKDGETFNLLLDNPVAGGNYTCRLPYDSPAARCLDRTDPALEGSTVNVDEVKARFSILEAEQSAIQQELKTENGRLKTDIADLRTENTFMREQISQLKHQVQTVEGTLSKTVIFHARLGASAHVSGGQRVIPTVVSVNQGGGYNSRTGDFVAPYSGQYFFTATAASAIVSNRVEHYAHLELMVDGAWVSVIWTKSVSYHEMGTCSYAGHLEQGQRVWLRAGEGDFYGHLTTFSGFLVSPDSD